MRPPDGIHKVVAEAGFECLRWRRAYPINIPWALFERWPNPLTKLFWHLCSHPLTYPLWGALASLNLPHRKDLCYFAYLLRQDNSTPRPS
jgi:hypothetical protein